MSGHELVDLVMVKLDDHHVVRVDQIAALEEGPMIPGVDDTQVRIVLRSGAELVVDSSLEMILDDITRVLEMGAEE